MNPIYSLGVRLCRVPAQLSMGRYTLVAMGMGRVGGGLEEGVVVIGRGGAGGGGGGDREGGGLEEGAGDRGARGVIRGREYTLRSHP